jgi:adenylate cyclase
MIESDPRGAQIGVLFRDRGAQLSGQRVERRLAAILAADVVGYSRLMGQDEAGTLNRLRTHRRELIDPKIVEHKGRVVKTTGDGILIEFPSVVEAVACAVAIQEEMVQRNAATPEDQRIVFRIGINLGDVIVEDGDIHGDGVNVAARLETLAEPGGICVSGIVHDQVHGRLECAFDDVGDQSLKNIARPVRVYRVRLGGMGASTMATTLETDRALPPPNKPSIAVLPFQNMSDDPEQEYFADGMVEEIITTLSRIRWLFVIARNSTFTYKGQAVDVKQIGRELGVRYLLEGSVRRSGNRVRITAQLVEAETGAHLWADHFDGSMEDVFDLQDQIAARVTGVIEPALQMAETARTARRATADLTAYDLYLRADALYLSSAARIPEAIGLLEQAIERDPCYGPALARAAVGYHRLLYDNRSEDRAGDQLRGIALARRALEVASNDPLTVVNAAFALAYFGEDISAMMTLVDRALAINPSFSRGWHLSGVLRLWAGQPDAAIEHLKTALRFSPHTRTGWSHADLGAAYFVSRRFDEALPELRLVVQEDPTLPLGYRFLAACLAHMGRIDEAPETIARLRAITPVLIPDASYLRNVEHRDLYLSGLRLASA